MSMDEAEFTAELQALLAAGRKIEAIKQYRERTGASLKEAKDAVEALETGQSLPFLPFPGHLSTDSPDLEREIVSILQQGQKIAAIKHYRERTGKGLKEAKDSVEAIARERGLATSGGGCLGVVLLALAILAVTAVAA